jgi:alpha-ketoglutarate-dependent taurine dioxygenase
MAEFHDTPIFESSSGEQNEHLLVLDRSEVSIGNLEDGLRQGQLILSRNIPFDQAGTIFQKLADDFGLRASYDMQMQYVVSLMEDRESVDDIAVTVNERGPYQIVQPHAEGDTTSPLDLFGLYCEENANSGGENILSLIDQSADHSKLRAKEKAIVGTGLSNRQINKLRAAHLDAKDVIETCDPSDRVLAQTEEGKIVVRTVPVKSAPSVISGQDLLTYWDNVTVHDHAFHRHHHEILRFLGILHEQGSNTYEPYMHVENDSDWAPADTDSGSVEEIARLFSCHVVHKMEPHDFLIFNNRAWTHAVNNWPPDQVRKLSAMYA